jgi:assimilatory nitrate reductase catalytic subunit
MERPCRGAAAGAARCHRTPLSPGGRTASTSFDASPTICACFGVKSQAILSAIADGARSTEAIGAQLNAGTNCGSCLPELRRMIAAARAPQKAKADLPA